MSEIQNAGLQIGIYDPVYQGSVLHCMGGAYFDQSDPEHLSRIKDIYVWPSGTMLIGNFFQRILLKNTQVLETEEFRKSLVQQCANKSEFRSMTDTVWYYRGTNAQPKWKNLDPDNYTQLCNIVTDLSHLPLEPKWGVHGKLYYEVHYDVVISFGLTEMKAQIAWKENGVEKRGRAEIL